MATVPAVLLQRWRSRNLTGQAKPQCVVRVRRGYVNKLYQPFRMLDTGKRPRLPVIWRGLNMNPWQGQWTLEGPWIPLPQIQSVKWTRDLTNDNGQSTLSVVMDNVAFHETEGLAGVYHTIDRGYFSPQKGIKVNSRPHLWRSNEWADVLNGGYQIEVWEGYGPDGHESVIPLAEAGEDGTCVPPNAAISRTWVGIIDACDIDAHPDQMTITARDFSVFLTDQRVIYHNKPPEIRSPVTFADRRRTLGEKRVGYGASASSHYPSHPAADALNGDGWVSAVQNDRTDTPHIEIKLKAGYYDQFHLATEAIGQAMYVAIKAVGGCRWNGAVVADGWIGGSGPTVPGTSVPYVNHYRTVANKSQRMNLGGELRCSEGTVLRLYFTHLTHTVKNDSGDDVHVNGWVAAVYRLAAYRYGTKPKAPFVPVATGTGAKFRAQGWVLVDDAADVVRMALMWAGFHEWDVEDFGWSLTMQWNFGQDAFLIDIINAVQNQGDFAFFMRAPSDHDMSIGVPCFKHQQGINMTPRVKHAVKDTDLLESLTVKWDLSNLPYSFRVRGDINKHGKTFGQDLSKRYMGTYFPPWSGIDYRKISPSKRGKHMDHSERLAGNRRFNVQTQGEVIALSLDSDAECLFAAVLTAVQFALASTTAQLQISGVPGIALNDALIVIDAATGTNTRVWVSSIESTHNLGQNGSWHMTIAGALLDTEDMRLIAEDWAYVVHKYGMRRG